LEGSQALAKNSYGKIEKEHYIHFAALRRYGRGKTTPQLSTISVRGILEYRQEFLLPSQPLNVDYQPLIWNDSTLRVSKPLPQVPTVHSTQATTQSTPLLPISAMSPTKRSDPFLSAGTLALLVIVLGTFTFAAYMWFT